MKTTTKSLKYFTLVKPNTKRGNTIRWYFEHVNKGGIYDAYVKQSYAKVRAYDDCMAMVREYNGFGEKARTITTKKYSEVNLKGCAFYSSKAQRLKEVFRIYRNSGFARA